MGHFINIGSAGLRAVGFDCLDRDPYIGVRLCDMRLGLPYPNDSAEVIVASHCLEHLHPLLELPGVLKDIHRVLMPTGTLRIAVPDLARLVKAYLDRSFTSTEMGDTQRGVHTKIDGVHFNAFPPALQFSAIVFGNNSGAVAYDGHHVAFDWELLQWTLWRAGFKDVREVGPDDSRHPTLLNRYRDIVAPEQIVVECTK